MYYKILRPNPDTGALESCHGGSMTWVPGIENSIVGKIEPCRNGLHLCRVRDISRWLKLDTVICSTTIDVGSMVVVLDKIVTRAATIAAPLSNILDQKLLRLLVCDFAERALLRRKHKNKPTDERSWNAITVSRQFANGLASREELRDAAADAAAYAAYAADAAYAAAYAADAAAAADAAGAAYAARAAAYAAAYADAAAYAAAYADAAYAAAGAAGWQEREWQGRRVLWACGLDIPEPKLDEGF